MRPPDLDPNSPTVRVAVFGQQVKDFLESPVGDYVVQRASAERTKAIEGLKTVNPFSSEDVLKLQLEVRWAEHFLGWLGAAVQDGQNAESQIEGEQEMSDG